jgi:hypothetical protein
MSYPYQIILRDYQRGWLLYALVVGLALHVRNHEDCHAIHSINWLGFLTCISSIKQWYVGATYGYLGAVRQINSVRELEFSHPGWKELQHDGKGTFSSGLVSGTTPPVYTLVPTSAFTQTTLPDKYPNHEGNSWANCSLDNDSSGLHSLGTA